MPKIKVMTWPLTEANENSNRDKLWDYCLSGMMDGIEYRKRRTLRKEQSQLFQMAQALMWYQKRQSFFLMIEGGQIDWAGIVMMQVRCLMKW